MSHRPIWFRAAVGLLLIALSGCEQSPGITEYRIPKEKPLELQGPAWQTLGAVVLRGSQAWFFKVSGPPDRVGASESTFDSFLSQVSFGKNPSDPPQWKLPEGWEESPAANGRYATIRMEKGPAPLEMSVTVLPTQDASPAQYLLGNLNRWRGQLGLPPLADEEGAKAWRSTKLASGDEVLTVSLVGKKSKPPRSGGALPAGHPPMNAGDEPREGVRPATGEAAPPVPDGPPAAKAAGGEGPVRYKLPSGWREGRGSAISVAAFSVGEGDDQANTTITAARGALLDNVNRWRTQLDLPPVDDAGLGKLVRKIEVGGRKWDLVELIDPASPKAILGGLTPAAEGGTWFVKFTGPKTTAEREKQHFEDLIRSLDFSGK